MPCYTKKAADGGTLFICGDLGQHCADCSGFGDYLCDYPVGEGKTCDRPLCDDHASEIAPDIHYCAGHRKMWDDFQATGGVTRALENVVPYKSNT